jgi:16S rRNA (guanine527-N7)-methyltransferase
VKRHTVDVPVAAQAVFGAQYALAKRYVELLAGPGVERGLIGPREADRLWERHMLNSAVLGELGLEVSVCRGRAEDPQVRGELGGKDVVTARAVAPLGRLAGWCLPLVAPGGRLLAVKGATAEEEAARDALAVRAAGGGPVEIVQCGGTIVRSPTTVIVVPRRIQRVTRTAGARRRKVQ